MISHEFINVLVTTTLIEMMVAIGLAVSLDDVISAARNWRRVARALAANYLVVPAAALVLAEFLVDSETLLVGFLIVAVFPGASYGPPFTTMARGDLSLSVGLMVLLAASSAIVGPVLLRLMLLLTSANTSLTVDVPRVIGMLLLTQLAPLAAGILIRKRAPHVAARLRGPAELLSKVMNSGSIGCILVNHWVNHWQQPGQAHFAGLPAMVALLTVSLAAGYLLGGPGNGSRKTVALTTSLRNIGVSVVVASSHEVGSAALTAVVAYAIVEISGSLVVALWWGQRQMGAARPRHFPIVRT
jgi:BASS family bile acid:Na+ symporter